MQPTIHAGVTRVAVWFKVDANHRLLSLEGACQKFQYGGIVVTVCIVEIEFF